MKSPAHNLASMLVRSARTFPNFTAVAEGVGEGVMTYAHLADRVARLAWELHHGLSEPDSDDNPAGLSEGDRVLIVSENSPRYLEALFACWHAGLVAVPVNAKLHPKEVAAIITACDARLIFASRGWWDALFESGLVDTDAVFGYILGGVAYEIVAEESKALPFAPVPVALDDPAWLFFTSGTTGKPKAATLTHGNLRAMCLAFLADVLPIEPGDAMVHAAPLSHGSGLYALPHVMKAAVNVTLPDGKFDPQAARVALDEWNGACTFGPPTIINEIVREARHAPVDGLKSVIFAGAPLYVEDLRRAWRVLDGRVTQIYGQGESPCTIASMTRAAYVDAFDHGDEHRLASVGVAQAGVELKIGENGEVLVRGPTVMIGYWGDPDATLKALEWEGLGAMCAGDGLITCEGAWLHTGDAGTLDADGFLTLSGRLSESIITGGSNVYPREVEEVLLRHPAVAEVCVLGRPDVDWGEEVVACVVANSADDEAELRAELDALCLANIARFKRPREYFFLPELPKSGYGKVLRRELLKIVTGDAS